MQKDRKKYTSISDYFTPELTKQFQIEMDIALKKIDINPVKELLEKYHIANFQDSIDFMEALDYCFNGWKKEHMGSKIYGEVTTSDSKCIACEHGTGMIVYEFEYVHAAAPIPMNRVVYGWDFGILFNIKKEILHEVRVCNAFLDRKEMSILFN
ncbi:hypothetical protein MAR621_03824 [Maribacter dokdonensis]|uniref:hypothetical protein n=1 Tax=Maribacter dokdonensis TaxID=320912 RepID=UPI001B03E01A|nr:hypothetical protein [Maribacter dokdonensis]CAG2533778.1 hypothetical protein MAR621_03824 [Maribacter dokdonensis]